MDEGLYESLVTAQLSGRLDAQIGLESAIAEIAEADQPHVLARHLHDVVLASCGLPATQAHG